MPPWGTPAGNSPTTAASHWTAGCVHQATTAFKTIAQQAHAHLFLFVHHTAAGRIPTAAGATSTAATAVVLTPAAPQHTAVSAQQQPTSAMGPPAAKSLTGAAGRFCAPAARGRCAAAGCAAPRLCARATAAGWWTTAAAASSAAASVSPRTTRAAMGSAHVRMERLVRKWGSNAEWSIMGAMFLLTVGAALAALALVWTVCATLEATRGLSRFLLVRIAIWAVGTIIITSYI